MDIYYVLIYEEGMATHSIILAWQAMVHGVTESDMTEQLSTYTQYIIYVFLNTGISDFIQEIIC